MEIPIPKKLIQPDQQIKRVFEQFYSINQEDSDVQSNQLAQPDLQKRILAKQFPKKTMNMTWCDRYFQLTPTRLLYYQDADKHILKGCFNVPSLIKYNLRLNAEYPIITLTVSVPQRQESQFQEKQLIKLLIENRECFSEWRNKITQTIQNCKRQHVLSFSPQTRIQDITRPFQKANGKNFWNKITISLNQFQSYADHLDIVFFRSNKPMAILHRLMMRSHFDHVGIIIKDEINRIFILQAIESRGVWLNEWNEILPTFKENYEEIGYRKLISSSKINQEALENFLNQSIGKKYELSLSKLFNITQESELSNLSSTYFCSQLIADLYIKEGLIKHRKKNDFWPKDFQQFLKLENDAYLSPLMQIQF